MSTGRESGLRTAGGRGGSLGANYNNIGAMLGRMPWFVLLVIVALTGWGTAVLYSSTYDDPSNQGLWLRHAARFVPALGIACALALLPLKFWARMAFPAYFLAVVLLVGVELFGVMGGGAARWLYVGPVRVQPSEFMKLAVTLALARYYHWVLSERRNLQSGGRNNPMRRDRAGGLRSFGRYMTAPFAGLTIHIPAAVMIIVPALLIVVQPDLGTALMVIATGFAIMVLAGVNLTMLWVVIAVQVMAVFVVPFTLTQEQRENPASGLGLGAIAYFQLLKPYQQKRVDSLLDPSSDPLGAGYQSEQAKIAIGSGGVGGKQWMRGTQSRLDYIPEQHTDFVFTAMAEEFGFVGSMIFMLTWAFLLGYGLYSAASCQSLFGKFAAGGATVTIAFYVAFNIGMVSGLLPVVGVPLPLVSYGGTAMLTVMACFGLILSVRIHRDEAVSANGLL